MEEENKRLKAQLKNVDGSITPESSVSAAKESYEPDKEDDFGQSPITSDTNEAELPRLDTQAPLTASIEQTYHGTTSTLFDADADPSRSLAAENSATRKRSSSNMQNKLIAAATRQRLFLSTRKRILLTWYQVNSRESISILVNWTLMVWIPN